MRICIIESDDLSFAGLAAYLHDLENELVRVQSIDEIDPTDLVIQGIGDVVCSPPECVRIELVGQANDARLCKAIQRSDVVLEQPFEPERMRYLVKEMLANPIRIRSISREVDASKWVEFCLAATSKEVDASELAYVISRDVGLFVTTLRLAGSVASPQFFFPTITGAVQRIGVERLLRLIRSGAFETLIRVRGDDGSDVEMSKVFKVSECSRAFVPDPLLAAVAYIVPIIRALPYRAGLPVAPSKLIRLLNGPETWANTLQDLEDGHLERPIAAAVHAAEYRTYTRLRTATYILRKAG